MHRGRIGTHHDTQDLTSDANICAEVIDLEAFAPAPAHSDSANGKRKLGLEMGGGKKRRTTEGLAPGPGSKVSDKAALLR